MENCESDEKEFWTDMNKWLCFASVLMLKTHDTKVI